MTESDKVCITLVALQLWNEKREHSQGLSLTAVARAAQPDPMGSPNSGDRASTDAWHGCLREATHVLSALPR